MIRHNLLPPDPLQAPLKFPGSVEDTLPYLALALLILAALLAPEFSAAHSKAKGASPAVAGPRLTSELSGGVAARDGGRLRLAMDLGNIVVHTQNSGRVDYSARLETDASQQDARQLLKGFNVYARETPDGVTLRAQTSSRRSSGRLWATLELNIPKEYSLEISTGGGNIETDDINGRVTLSTAGGSIKAGNIGGPARIQTDGGHITVKNVNGELVAATGGGHITAGSVGGSAFLHTSGGHIRVAMVEGIAHLETGGGNITLEHSGADLLAETAGGQIEVGEAAGLVRAKTGGGGIHVVRLSGPTELQTGGGSIYLTQVDSAVRASTGAGGITAWFVAPAKRPSTCELESSDGDIVVYLPRELPVTIDAQIQKGDEHRVIFDPAFPLKVRYDESSKGARIVRAEGSLNGGGELLRLRTVAGNIRVALSDANKQSQIYRQQMDQLQQQLQLQMRKLEQSQQPGADSPEP
jgi:DUF4097 and DUF4098 domain-containing protein YvlB